MKDKKLTTIGGSDIGTILGLNPYKSRLHWILEALDIMPKEEFSFAKKEILLTGQLEEKLILERFAHYDLNVSEYVKDNNYIYNMKNGIEKNNVYNGSDIFPELIKGHHRANIDGMLIDDNREIMAIIEAKTIISFEYNRWAKCPPSHYAQVQWYMYMYEVKIAYLCFLIKDTSHFIVEKIDANIDFQKNAIKEADKVIKIIDDFYKLQEENPSMKPLNILEKLGVNMDMNDFDFADYIKEIYQDDGSEIKIDDNPKLIRKINNLTERKKQIKGFDKECEDIKKDVQKYMLDSKANILTYEGKPVITWRKLASTGNLMFLVK